MHPDTPAIDTPAHEGAPDTAFVSTLDARQRAMLAEMGVRVWAPRPAAPASPPVVPTAETQATRPPAAAPVATGSPRPHAPVPPESTVAVPAPRQAPAPASRPPPVPVPDPSAPLAPVADGLDSMGWTQLRETVAGCQACGLGEGRTRAVFGVGHEQASLMIVGDAPGAAEDLQGEPYLGEAGQMLDSMLRALGRSRTGLGEQAVYVTHVTRCRPSTNRNPQAAEVARCAQYLARQVALLSPRVIVAMGPLAAQALLQSHEPIGRLRGQVHRFQGVPVIVTFPPSHLLRTPANKGKAWADLCLALDQVQG